MKSVWLSIIFILSLVGGLSLFHYTRSSTNDDTGNWPVNTFVELPAIGLGWQRPVGPPIVGLQVGHWKNQELPDELESLRISGGGTSGGGKAEWEVNLKIAELTATRLRQAGITVEILPATVPPNYWADVFVAIHADGSENPTTSGYKVAAPRRDITGRAKELAEFLEAEYGQSTRLILDPNITRNMTGYYAFNWRRYEHSINEHTTALIVETGFLTNPSDRKVIVSQPELSAQGIAAGILAYLQSKGIV